jgi:hypothetical protein
MINKKYRTNTNSKKKGQEEEEYSSGRAHGTNMLYSDGELNLRISRPQGLPVCLQYIIILLGVIHENPLPVILFSL